jgi:Mrp family chromosome partitioning ATPase
MSKTAAIRERTFPAAGATIASDAPPASRADAELAARLFGGMVRPKVIAFTSANSREGVTRVVLGLAAELARAGCHATVLDGAERLARSPILETADPSRPSTGISWTPYPGGERLWEMRDNSDCVLVDCGSLERSVDLLHFASMADGVVVIVEAGRTSKHQIEWVAKLIREVGGTLLGCVLNKRRYPVPGWLYRLL